MDALSKNTFRMIVDITDRGLKDRFKQYETVGKQESEEENRQIESVLGSAQKLVDLCKDATPLCDSEEFLLKGVLLLVSEMVKSPQSMVNMVSEMFNIAITQMMEEMGSQGLPPDIMNKLSELFGKDQIEPNDHPDSINGQGEKLVAELMPEVKTLQ